MEAAATPSAANNNIGPVGLIPLQRGFNASLISSSQHDSGAGWSSTLSPSVAYRLNPHVSFDTSVPVVLYALSTVLGGSAARPTSTQKISRLTFGDVALAGHLDLPVGETFFYTLTPTVTFPSGNSSLGLGAGQVTYDFNNHFEAELPLNPFVEIGIGDNSALVNRRVRRGQNSVGLVSHFEAGGALDLPRDIAFAVSAYEILPIGSQTVYSTRTVRKRTVTRATGVTGLAEDNGFNTSLDIPLQRHVVLSGFYNRSLRQHNDTVGFSFTLLARGRPKGL